MIPSLFLLAFFLSCRSVPLETGWTGIQKRSEIQWVLKVLENDKAILVLPFSSRTEIHGEAFENESGHWIFHTDELHLFFNGHDGWTEAVIALEGILELIKKDENNWVLKGTEPPRTGSVLQAEIRYRRDKIYADRAVDMMNRRLDRVLALSGFVRTALKPEDYDFFQAKKYHRKKGYNPKDFEADLKSLLFPELYGFSDEFPEPESSLNEEERYIRSEEVLWDSQYTREYFPEELLKVRDSGTLLRDYDEASELIILFCLWQELWESWLPSSDIRSTE